MPFTTLNNDSFRALFDYASIGILIADSSGVIHMANRYICQQFGYEEDELVGVSVEQLIPSRYRDRHVGHRNRYNGDPHSRPMGVGMELSGLKKNGAEFPVEVSLGHYMIKDSKFTLAFISDITQRKETEQAIKQLNTHLEEKVKEGTQSLALMVEQLGNQIKETERKDIELQRVNNFLNNIWNHAGAIIMVCDRGGIIQFFNPAAEKALGYNAIDVVGKSSSTIFHKPEDLHARAEELSESTGKPVKPGFEVLALMAELTDGEKHECHYVRKDSSEFFVSVEITPLRDTSGDITSYLCIAIDISEKKKAESELRAALRKEMELNELKSRFVSMASHEFRTPLSAVLSSAYLLSKYTKEEEQPQREKHIQRIVSSVTSLTEILNDFLSVGKIEEGNIQPRFTEFDLKEQTEKLLPEVQHLLKKEQHIDYEHSGNGSKVELDQSMLRHIMVNLMSNAIKFSPEGSTIWLKTETLSSGCILSVKDEGIGIPEEDQSQLFRRFFRSSNATNIQGTGLGLHIVQKYTELMNGSIRCVSKPGKGTEFILTFQ